MFCERTFYIIDIQYHLKGKNINVRDENLNQSECDCSFWFTQYRQDNEEPKIAKVHGKKNYLIFIHTFLEIHVTNAGYTPDLEQSVAVYLMFASVEKRSTVAIAALIHHVLARQT